MSSLHINEENQEKAIQSFLMLMLKQDDSHLSIDELLQIIGSYFQADRAYIFEDDESKTYAANTFEWCAPGVKPEIDNLQYIPMEYAHPWQTLLKDNASVFITVDAAYAEKEPLIYNILAPQGIHCLMFAPLTVNGEFVGFLGVDNPARHTDQTLFLSVAASLLCKERIISREKDSMRLKNQIVSSLSRAYFCLYYLDLQAGTFEEIEPTKNPEVAEKVGTFGTIREKMELMSRCFVVPEDAPQVLEFTELSTVADRLHDRDSIGIHFRGPTVGWCEGVFVAVKRDETGRCTHALWVVRSINSEMEKDNAYREKLNMLTESQTWQLQLINTLSQDYLNVYRIIPRRNVVAILKLGGYVTEGLSIAGAPEYPYEETCLKYIRGRVYKDDVDMMIDVMKLENIEKALNAGKDYVGTYRVLDQGEIHYYQYKYVRIEGSDEIIAGFQNVDTMIANEKEQRDRLQAALDAAKKSNIAKTAFLARMSHDIRTPLNGIIGLMEISEKHADDRKLIDENRAKARIAADHLLSLISDVLELSKLDEENIYLANEVIDLRRLADEVLTIVGLRSANAGIRLTHDAFDQSLVYPYVYASPLHVRQVLINIFTNCIKYNKPHGSINSQIEMIGKTDTHVTYRATISDTGIGMSEEFLSHLFEPFSQERSDARSTYQGTGLGMSIVKRLMEKMGGSIEVTSKQGEGSTFVLYFTFAIAKEEDLPEKESTANADLNGVKVLLVEDNELNAEIARTILEDLGAIVTEAHNGQEAVDLFTAGTPGTFDLILMDLMMPIMDGLEATRTIRSLPREDALLIPIVAMTANAFDEDRRNSLSAGMNDHLAKPIDVPALLKSLTRILG